MKPGRPTRVVEYEKISNISLPRSTLARVKILLADPLTGRVKYGALSGLIARLLQEWTETQITRSIQNDPIQPQ